MQPISVVIPTWNREKTLARAIESALLQSAPPREILVCDDGSIDHSSSLVASYSSREVIWLPGRRGGLPSIPRNRGIACATGDWIAFLDSDDAWSSDKLERQLAAMAQLGLMASSTGAVRVLPDGSESGPMSSYDEPTIPFSRLVQRNYIITSSVVVHRDILRRVGGFPEGPQLKVGEDYALWLRVAMQTAFAYLPEPLVRYADDEATSVRAGAPDGWTQRINVLDDAIAWCESNAVAPGIVLRLRAERTLAGFRRAVAPLGRKIRGY